MRFLSLTLLALLLTACRPDVSNVSNFQSIDEEGWWREDTLTFSIDTLRPNTRYAVTLSLRTAAAPDVYPYTDLTLAVRRQFIATDSAQAHFLEADSLSYINSLRALNTTDTLRLTLSTPRGDAQGRGTSLFQYDFPIGTLTAPASVSAAAPLTLSIHHLMRRDPLPGIRDVGITLRALP